MRDVFNVTVYLTYISQQNSASVRIPRVPLLTPKATSLAPPTTSYPVTPAAVVGYKLQHFLIDTRHQGGARDFKTQLPQPGTGTTESMTLGCKESVE